MPTDRRDFLLSGPLVWLWAGQEWMPVEAVQVWPIWSEGCVLAGGGHAVAQYAGAGIGASFKAACASRFRGDRDFRTGPPPTWGRRRLFQTEAEARAAFG